MPLIEAAAKDALKILLTEQSAAEVSNPSIPDFQIVLKSDEISLPLRSLNAESVNKIVKVSYPLSPLLCVLVAHLAFFLGIRNHYQQFQGQAENHSDRMQVL